MAREGTITKFGLRNFKAFRYLEDIEVRPLTVLVGANSAGKSSLLQSLLLLKQTSASDRFSGVLKFDGDWVHLGSFANIISDFDLSRELEYRFQILYREAMGFLPLFFLHIAQPETHTEIFTSEVDIQICFECNPDTKKVSLKEFTVIARIPGLADENQSIHFTVADNGKEFLSTNLSQITQTAHLVLDSENNSGFFTGKPSSVEIDHFWPSSFVYEGEKWRSPGFVPLPPIIRLSISKLRDALQQKLEYLGPVRADPRPFYPVEEVSDIGIRGEATVPYLLHHKNDTVEYTPSLTMEVREATLLEAVNHWLRCMNVTDELTIAPVESIAYRATVQSATTPSRPVDLSQVGFGVGQLLPVLVMGLKQPTDSMLLLEQPEIHLHPRLQGELAEFLLCAAKTGKTILVETHSDHLINRLRRCIAEDETGELAKMVNILFVHPGTEDNPGSYVEPLEIDATGSIVNWPPDFLSESANESLAILRASQRKAHAMQK